jgi:hypothetical protein
METELSSGADLFQAADPEEEETWTMCLHPRLLNSPSCSDYHAVRPTPMSDFFDSELFSDCTLVLTSGRRLHVHR